jgi:hypothetical protein
MSRGSSLTIKKYAISKIIVHHKFTFTSKLLHYYFLGGCQTNTGPTIINIINALKIRISLKQIKYIDESLLSLNSIMYQFDQFLCQQKILQASCSSGLRYYSLTNISFFMQWSYFHIIYQLS